jgi:hypothetical protein
MYRFELFSVKDGRETIAQADTHFEWRKALQQHKKRLRAAGLTSPEGWNFNYVQSCVDYVLRINDGPGYAEHKIETVSIFYPKEYEDIQRMG